MTSTPGDPRLRVPANPEPAEAVQRRLDDLDRRLAAETGHFLGYPCTADFDYSALDRFLRYPINNVGDPYVPSNYHINTHDFEREVLSTFERLTDAPPGQSWGYVTNGGTEGNMYGIFLGRELFPDGVVYYSEDTHYSVSKILRALHVRSIMIKSGPDGRIDLEDLAATIGIHRDVPPIIVANIGTTMKGAIDDLLGIRAILRELAIPRHYIHADAALHGMILPFVDDPQPWNFAAGIDSIAISGHKFIGAPMPCGVVVAKKANVDRIARHIEYVGTLDTTLSGSRNALSPLFLWYALNTVGIDGFRRRAEGCLAMADYAIERLEPLGLHPWRHRNSPIVAFDRPDVPSLLSRWQLAVNGPITHLITMPHVTREKVDALADDLAASLAMMEEARS
jgi:histidine decarboxylase